jgi:Fe-S cluster biogenesis protein NfuA
MAETRLDDEAVEQRLAAVEERLDKVQQFPGPTSEAAIEAVQALLEVYGEALARVLDEVRKHAGTGLLDALCADELVAHLLALHDLHPASVEDRVRQVIDQVAAELAQRGGSVELLGVEDGTARVKVSSGGGCGSCGSGADLEGALADAILALAPELGTVVPEKDTSAQTTLIPVEALLRSRPGRPPAAVPG